MIQIFVFKPEKSHLSKFGNLKSIYYARLVTHCLYFYLSK